MQAVQLFAFEFISAFRKMRFGMGIMQYITERRIERAKELLAEGKSIADTAEECGFADYNYFCKVFRKHTGASPSAYKKLRK